MKKLYYLSCLFFSLISLTAFAGPVPDTGVTKCYDNNTEITCPQPGEPFYGQDAQYTCNPHSYTDLGNGIVQDNITGLMWQQATAPGTYNWDQAITYCSNLVLGGYSDWRLPTINELSYLIDSSIPYTTDSSINATYFPNTLSYYWSSTIESTCNVCALIVYFYGGYVGGWNMTDPIYVRAVRGAQEQTHSYIDNYDGTVTDAYTGLMWQQATSPGTYTWEQALTYCENLTLAGHSDWRLPDKNELQSIVNYTRSNPSIGIYAFPGTVSSNYWSSTPSSNAINKAWYVNFNLGNDHDTNKKSSFYVRAVHGGPCVNDSDGDGNLNDGDNSTVAGDNPCTGGNTDNCDDNCPDMPNGPNYGTCVMTIGNIVYASYLAFLESCMNNRNCTCQMEQGDSNGNGIGDVCECYADCDNSSQVNVFDLIILKNEYNRDDCSVNPCDADCNDDGSVGVFDLIIMKNQYNRSGCLVIQ